MAFRIYTSKNLLKVVNTEDWDVQSFPKNECWYRFNNLAAPILYSIYYKVAERPIVLDKAYTDFQRGDGSFFYDDTDLQDEWDNIIGQSDKADFNYGGQLDAGNRLRVSQLTAQIDIKQTNDNQPLFFDREVIGAGSQVYSKSKGGVTMSVSGNNDVAIAQTKYYGYYLSGKSQLIELTFSGMSKETNVIKRAGYFSSNITTPYNSNKDGIWFEVDGSEYRFIIEKNGTEILNVVQDDWNKNRLLSFDGSKFQVFIIQFLYLGGTVVKFGFMVNGVIDWCHEYSHAGNISSTFVESPNQPVRYEIRSTGGSGSFDQICCQVSSEGTVDQVGVHRDFEVENFQANSAGTIYAVLGLRLKADYRNIAVLKQELSVLTKNNDACIFRASINPTVAGTLTYSDVDNSSLQTAEGATANTISDLGTVISIGYAQGNSTGGDNVPSSLRIGGTLAGVMDELVISVQPLSNGLDVYVTTGIQEFI